MRNMYKKFIMLLFPITILTVLALIMLLENIGVAYSVAAPELEPLPASVLSDKKYISEMPKTCLLIRDSSQEEDNTYYTHLQDVMESMRVGYQVADINEEELPELSTFKTIVIGTQYINELGSDIIRLCDWAEKGGGLMLFCAPTPSPVTQYLLNQLGAKEGGNIYAQFRGMEFSSEFMLGNKQFTNYRWEEPMATALNLQLDQNSQVYAWSDDENKIPLLWRTPYGEGRIVVNNHGMCEKTTRGLTAMAYSLLEDTCIYPVINASAFFLDDFPSPVPMGDGKYIRQDYHRNISSFYSNVWLPDIMKFSDTYGVKYTGMLIQTYDEEVDPPFMRITDQERFLHFGALLLNNGGEIGLHGYNHLPLCFTGFDFKGEVNYKPWKSREDAAEAVAEGINFAQTIFPEVKIQCYVPPSNILSEEGRRLLSSRFPQIKTLSSLYLEGDIEYSQEFEISDDGIVEFPRVISGAVIDQYMYWAAINTLNLYYVNSHFMHPDDVLDEDRGAAEGWEIMHGYLERYMEWLYGSAPSIRNMTATEASAALQRYDVLSVERTERQDRSVNDQGEVEELNYIHLRLGAFWDEAWMMIRCNEGVPIEVQGGSVEHIDGDFYLLRATTDLITLTIKK